MGEHEKQGAGYGLLFLAFALCCSLLVLESAAVWERFLFHIFK